MVEVIEMAGNWEPMFLEDFAEMFHLVVDKMSYGKIVDSLLLQVHHRCCGSALF